MALLYRAIWDESRDELTRVGAEAMLRWLQDTKHLEIDGLPPSELRGRLRYNAGGLATDGEYELTTRHGRADEVTALQLRLVENRPSLGQCWTTTFTTLSTDAPGGTFWVDIERVSADPFQYIPFHAPNLVHSLLMEGQDPRVANVRLEARPIAIAGAPLAGVVTNASRRIPVVVFSHDDNGGADLTIRRAKESYKRLAAVAAVYVLPPDEVDEFNVKVGADLGVWRGAARLYLPIRDSDGLRSERHRYVPAYRMARSPASAAEMFAELLRASVPATPPPPQYDTVRRALTGVEEAHSYSELLRVAEASLQNNERTIQDLRSQLEARDDAYFDLQVENEALEVELNRRAAAVERSIAWQRNGQSNGNARVFELPDEVTSIAEALEAAQRLPNLEVHPDAPRDIEKLDGAVSGKAWANGVWRGLRALDAYGDNAEELRGGFWEWCQKTGSAWSWPASSKKLAMRESESVMANDRLRAARLLPVGVEVDCQGRVEMQAHLKIAEGGGSLAPRIYFHDDTGGPTGRVHVGYVGPHEHMPNQGTN